MHLPRPVIAPPVIKEIGVHSFAGPGDNPLTTELAPDWRSCMAGTAESRLAALALAGLVAMRIAYAFMYRVDSDEPQHLHVVWGWVHGMLPYRDLFDNHCPLFQMLCSPLMWLLGEHAWIVVQMRIAMLPLYIADLWLIYLVGRRLYVHRAAVWMALIAGGIPLFFLVTTEFRTDDLWTTIWLTAVWLAVSGPMVGRRALIFGLTMGTCCAVSTKTSLLLVSLGFAAAGLLVLHVISRRSIDVKTIAKSLGLILAGMVVVPALLAAFFTAHGAMRQMYYCVVQHNAAPGLGKWRKSGFHLWLFPLSLPVLLALGWICIRHSRANARSGVGRALILMTGGAYYFLLRSYCPLVTAQDFLPLVPLAALTLLPLLFHLLRLTRLPSRIFIPVAGVLLLGCEGVAICALQSPMDDQMKKYEQSLAIALHLTNPKDFVMDGKGETIFRNRPTYWVFEGVTIRRIQVGLIPDDARERMIQTETHVAINHRLRPDDQRWLEANFLEGDGKIWVAGENLGLARPAIACHTDIAGTYSIVSDGGKLNGKIDGTQMVGSEKILPGNHLLKIASGTGNVALVWTQALDRGFNPFTGRIAGISP